MLFREAHYFSGKIPPAVCNVQYYFNKINPDLLSDVELYSTVTYPSINSRVKNHQCDEREHIVHEEIHPMDVQSDVILVASQFGWVNAVHRDIILPMLLVVHFDLPESE